MIIDLLHAYRVLLPLKYLFLHTFYQAPSMLCKSVLFIEPDVRIATNGLLLSSEGAIVESIPSRNSQVIHLFINQSNGAPSSHIQSDNVGLPWLSIR